MPIYYLGSNDMRLTEKEEKIAALALDKGARNGERQAAAIKLIESLYARGVSATELNNEPVIRTVPIAQTITVYRDVVPNWAHWMHRLAIISLCFNVMMIGHFLTTLPAPPAVKSSTLVSTEPQTSQWVHQSYVTEEGAMAILARQGITPRAGLSAIAELDLQRVEQEFDYKPVKR